MIFLWHCSIRNLKMARFISFAFLLLALIAVALAHKRFTPAPKKLTPTPARVITTHKPTTPKPTTPKPTTTTRKPTTTTPKPTTTTRKPTTPKPKSTTNQLYRLVVDGEKGCSAQKMTLVCHAPDANTFKNIDAKRFVKVSYAQGDKSVVKIAIDTIKNKLSSASLH